MTGDGRRSVAGEYFPRDLLLFDPMTRVPEETVDVGDSHSGDDTLDADAAIFPSQEAKEFVLEVVGGRKIGMQDRRRSTPDH